MPAKTNLPALPDRPQVPATELQHEIDAAAAFAAEQHAPATRRAYCSDFAIFSSWCEERAFTPLPAKPAAIATFLSAQAEAGVKTSTLSRRVAAIRYAHTSAGLEPPTSAEVVKATMKGIRRSLGVATAKKAPATVERLLEMLEAVPDSLRGKRDRAILLVGFSGAFRRSEIAALTVEDLEEVEGGLRVHLRRSKTDQEAKGQVVAILRGKQDCPVKAVNAWLKAAGIETGPVFRRMAKGNKVMPEALTPHSIGAIVKTYAGKAGLDPAKFAGHSLRAGFLTSAAARGASIWKLMDVSRHRSVETLRGYVRRAEEFEDHAATGLL